MANTVISPNMGLPTPVVSDDPGPDWAQNVNSCLSIIDGHNHTPGSGVQITPAGISINADLPFNGNDATLLRSARFSAQGSPLMGATDLGCLYESGVDLYFNDGSGNQVRITQSGSVTGATGTITGLPSGTASAAFSVNTFTFQSATSTPAYLASGPLIIGQPVASGKTVTIAPNASQASNYALNLPLSLPNAGALLGSDSSGNLSFVGNVLSNEASLPSITWTASVTPSTITGSGYKYNQIAGSVTFFWRIKYTNGGSGITQAYFQLPAGVPAPDQWTAGGSAGYSYPGQSTLGGSFVGAQVTSSITFLDFNNLISGQWAVAIQCPSTGPGQTAWYGSITYPS